MKRFGQPEEVAGATILGLSRRVLYYGRRNQRRRRARTNLNGLGGWPRGAVVSPFSRLDVDASGEGGTIPSE
jgi:hypothetical protein